MLGRFDRAWYWLNMAEGYPAPRRHRRRRRGSCSARSRSNPRNADLWVGLGNALVAPRRRHDEPGRPARLRRAPRALAPDHPGPRFFYGLALAQGGNYDEAERIWRALLADAPPDAEYRRIDRGAARRRSAQARAAGAQIPGGPRPRPRSPAR